MSPLIPIAKEDPPSSDELRALPPPQWPQKFDKATRTVGEYQCHNASNTKFRASSANSYSAYVQKGLYVLPTEAPSSFGSSEPHEKINAHTHTN